METEIKNKDLLLKCIANEDSYAVSEWFAELNPANLTTLTPAQVDGIANAACSVMDNEVDTAIENGDRSMYETDTYELASKVYNICEGM